MDPEYARRYRDLYERHWWWRAREAVILRTLRRICPRNGWDRILDVGCGNGLFFDTLAAFGHVEGVEPASALVSETRARSGRIYVGPWDDRFRPAHPFGLILMLDVLEHLDDPVGALRHALAVLEPGGTLVATVPAFRSIWTTHDDLNEHRTRYTKQTMRALAAAAGLEIMSMEYFFQWTYPVKLVQRAVEAVTRPRPAPVRVPAEPVNRALYVLSRLEYAALRWLRPPFGSSLLVVARAAR